MLKRKINILIFQGVLNPQQKIVKSFTPWHPKRFFRFPGVWVGFATNFVVYLLNVVELRGFPGISKRSFVVKIQPPRWPSWCFFMCYPPGNDHISQANLGISSTHLGNFGRGNMLVFQEGTIKPPLEPSTNLVTSNSWRREETRIGVFNSCQLLGLRI